jgi:hypothetical protein
MFSTNNSVGQQPILVLLNWIGVELSSLEYRRLDTVLYNEHNNKLRRMDMIRSRRMFMHRHGDTTGDETNGCRRQNELGFVGLVSRVLVLFKNVCDH